MNISHNRVGEFSVIWPQFLGGRGEGEGELRACWWGVLLRSPNHYPLLNQIFLSFASPILTNQQHLRSSPTLYNCTFNCTLFQKENTSLRLVCVKSSTLSQTKTGDFDALFQITNLKKTLPFAVAHNHFIKWCVEPE